MNIFQKIGFINRGLKAIKEIRKKIETTTIDDDMKDIFSTLVNCLERLKNKFPEAKDFVVEIIDIIKKSFKLDKKK